MRFNKLVGLKGLKQELTEQILQGQFPHAMIFLGPEGAGALPLAILVSRLLLCLQPTMDGPCESCTACQKTLKFIHPDWHFSFPTVGSKAISNLFLTEWRQALTESPYLRLNDWLSRLGAENKQGNITKDECLQIVKKISLKGFESDRKIVLLWRPEFLGKEGNRLLKSIEEPPAGTIFLLVAQNADAILNTILSRCQLTKLPALQDREIADALMAEHDLTETKALSLARLSHGSFAEALSLMTEVDQDLSQWFLEWMRACWAGNGTTLVALSENLAKQGRESIKFFFHYVLHFFQELLHIQMVEDLPVRLREEEALTAKKMAGVLSWPALQQMVEKVNQGIQAIERNANAKILFLHTSIELHYLFRK